MFFFRTGLVKQKQISCCRSSRCPWSKQASEPKTTYAATKIAHPETPIEGVVGGRGYVVKEIAYQGEVTYNNLGSAPRDWA